jgi:hypothetical protein
MSVRCQLARARVMASPLAALNKHKLKFDLSARLTRYWTIAAKAA